MRHNKSRSARLARGFTIAELLTVTVIFGLLLTTIAAVMPVVLKSPSQMQAQVDEVDAAALALYKVQRDARQSDINGVFNCTITPLVACVQQVGPVPQNTQAIAIAGDDGTTQFVNNVGGTKWKGYVVYWLAPSAAGVGMDLMRSFQSITPFPFNNGNLPIFQTSDAITAVVAAVAQPSPSVAAPDVRQLLSSVSPADGIVALQMVAGVNRGDITGITLNGNTYARN
jgi:type II secretory pathway pseudopilin PulG